MLKKFLILLTSLTSVVFSDLDAKALHVVHNVYAGGFSIDGNDLFFDEGNKREVKLGDQFYIERKEIEKVAGESYRNILLLTNPQNRQSTFFKTRVINNQDSSLIIAAETINNWDYKITLEDGSEYRLILQNEPSLFIEPGDTLSFGGLNYFAVEEKLYSKFDTISTDGTKRVASSADGERFKSLWRTSGMGYYSALFFGGARLSQSYTTNKTWNYPHCDFLMATLSRDQIPLKKFCQVYGTFRKPNPLFKPNTFRIRCAEEQEVKRAWATIQSYYVVEFFDFCPGRKLSLDNPDDLKKVQGIDTLHFIKKESDQKFIFETPKKDKIILTTNLVLRYRVY